MSEGLDRQQRWKQQREDADRQRIGGAYIQGFMETAAALVEEEPLFSKGYWRCAKGCRPFGMGLARTPSSVHIVAHSWSPGSPDHDLKQLTGPNYK